ncbi:MAG: c-type cytochrome [Pseudomonadaceae bacterium]|nr:c-type cytochrome [Pseudomonadaceae bacterium]
MRDRRFPALTLSALLCVSSPTHAEETPFYLTIDTPPAPELSAEEALDAFTVAPGFVVEAVAVEPLVEDPVAITWDEDGKLYAVEMRGFMPDEEGSGEREPVGVVVRLHDDDADGVFDRREVLLDKLVLPRAVAIVNEGLLVGEPPNLWLCPSASGFARDIDCSAKRNLGTYGDQPGSVEHAENGLLLALDNWLYNAKSNRRMRIEDGELVVEPTLFRGQWGIAQDNDGRLFYNTNSNLLSGDSFDAQGIVASGASNAPGLGERIVRGESLHAVRVNTGVNRAYVPGVLKEDGRLNHPTSASGMAINRSGALPEMFAQDAFVAEPAANAVAQLRIRYDGLSITAEQVLYPDERWGQVEFLASTDERFRPVDVQLGPDGMLYVVDMYRGIIQDHMFLSDELKAQALARQLEAPIGMGRIWRVRPAALTPPQSPALADASTDVLVAELASTNGWVRDTAQRLLIGRDERRLSSRIKRVLQSDNERARVHALWTLQGRGELDRRTVLRSLEQEDAALSLAAIRAGAELLKARDLLRLLAANDDAVIGQHLVLALATHNQRDDVLATLVARLIESEGDRFLPAAIRAASVGQESAMLTMLSAGNDWSAARESESRFVQGLATQGVAGSVDTGAKFLDFVSGLDANQRHLQVAVLDGLFDLTRQDGFERVVLTEPHPVFETEVEALWPAMARARRGFTWPGDDLDADAKPLTPSQQANRAEGEAFFKARCASCHGVDGQGIVSLGPKLADSPWVTESAERLLRIALHGLSGPIEVAGETWNGVMPGHGAMPDFTNDVAAGLLTYLNRAWGHTGRAVEPSFVAEVREQTAERTGMWTVAELLEVDINTHYQRYTGRYGSPAFELAYVFNGAELEVRSGIFNGPLIEEKEDHFLFEPRQLRIEFIYSDSGDVVAMRMPGPDGDMVLPRIGD